MAVESIPRMMGQVKRGELDRDLFAMKCFLQGEDGFTVAGLLAMIDEMGEATRDGEEATVGDG